MTTLYYNFDVVLEAMLHYKATIISTNSRNTSLTSKKQNNKTCHNYNENADVKRD